jgi:hypothetical protein
VKPEDVRSGTGVIAQIASTLLGFVLAALAILATVLNTRLLRNMQRTGHYQVLLRRMFYCVLTFGVITVAGLIVLFIPTLQVKHAYVMMFLSVFAFQSLVDVCQKFWIVLSRLHPE